MLKQSERAYMWEKRGTAGNFWHKHTKKRNHKLSLVNFYIENRIIAANYEKFHRRRRNSRDFNEEEEIRSGGRKKIIRDIDFRLKFQ
jgi:hypothetical protein